MFLIVYKEVKMNKEKVRFNFLLEFFLLAFFISCSTFDNSHVEETQYSDKYDFSVEILAGRPIFSEVRFSGNGDFFAAPDLGESNQFIFFLKKDYL